MKKYNTPKVDVVVTSQDDIMIMSDTFVDVGGLWGSEDQGQTPAE